MEHGLQTHIVPESPNARMLTARRLGFAGTDELDSALTTHTSNVRRVYDRLFSDTEPKLPPAVEDSEPQRDVLDQDSTLATASARIFTSHTQAKLNKRSIQSLANRSLNPHRALVQASRIAASLEKTDRQLQLSEANLNSLMQLCGASDAFAEMIAANPMLITSLGAAPSSAMRHDYRAILRSAIDSEQTFSGELAALRLKWAELMVEVGALDSSNQLSIFEANRLQTELAIASLNVAYLVARRELARRHGPFRAGPRVAFYGLGRLASSGVDYGSDLDILITYDSLVPSPIRSMTQDQAYSRLVELMIAALSSITREGYLYRIDLRLRPHGKNGPLVTSSDSFLDYLRDESAPWEWLAYVKLRAVGGDQELGRMIETHARHRIHGNALKFDPQELKAETLRVRDRLEREKGRRGRQVGTDIKYGPGGMLDVYFAARYLQLRDEVLDEGEDRSTIFTLERLREEGSLGDDDFETLSTGYSLLRKIDHNLRLIVGRSTRLPDSDHVIARDVAKRMEVDSMELQRTLIEQMKGIRSAYNRILE
jgi:glutamate-ammonia-ligase adenylyltransferase